MLLKTNAKKVIST